MKKLLVSLFACIIGLIICEIDIFIGMFVDWLKNRRNEQELRKQEKEQ